MNINFVFCCVCTNQKVICWLEQDNEICFRNIFRTFHLIRSDITVTRFCAFVMSGALQINRNYYCCNKSLFNGHFHCSIGLFQHTHTHTHTHTHIYIYIYMRIILYLWRTCVRAWAHWQAACSIAYFNFDWYILYFAWTCIENFNLLKSNVNRCI